MPYLDPGWLVLAAAFAVGARFAPPRAWPWARDALSVAFLAWWSPVSLATFVLTALVAWWASRRGGAAVGWLGLAVVALVFVAVRIAQRSVGVAGAFAPIGFGFFAMRLVHWWVETRRSALPPHGLRDFLAWLMYLPSVVVGPLQPFDGWLRWERRRRWDDADAATGLGRVVHGFGKIVVLAGWLAGEVLPRALGSLPIGVSGLLIGVATLYWTFSGVSDLAIGLGRIGGQRIPENFDHPFAQPDLPAFWRSWHRSVSDWARTYVYLPMLARTRSPRLAAAAAMTTFALWHELSPAYLVWGAWHGAGIGLWYRVSPTGGFRRPLPRLVSHAATIAWVLAGFWILRVWPRGGAWYAR